MVYRVFIGKKSNENGEKLMREIKSALKISLTDAREILRYDVMGVNGSEFKKAVKSVLSQPPLDNVYLNEYNFEKDYKVVAIGLLNGQFDQRADSAAACIQVLTLKDKPLVSYAKLLGFKGITEEEFKKIKKYLINPVDSEEKPLERYKTLKLNLKPDNKIKTVKGFINLSNKKIEEYHAANNFAMTAEDLVFVRDYFKKTEKRNPTETELKVLDTYWSDHCRHSTFLTEITSVKINSNNVNIKKTYDEYQSLFKELYVGRNDKYTCLMDLATIAVKKLRKLNLLNDLDVSEEVNACSLNVKIKVDGKDEDYILMFKNETHNHPTEIEPYGGANTCIGGAIRDPLSGRTFVFQAMRITGAGDITEPVDKTLPSKLSQRFLTQTAARGYSSYGNQIGLPAGYLDEIYHNGFKAKRMEAGFVVSGALKSYIYRETPKKGDVVLLIGANTGRDGCGGATSSSKSHTEESVKKCSTEVQRGNPLIERNIVRLFADKNFSTMIKKCNDFGAGGVSVAIGELADGLDINLDVVPRKYEGLSPTEAAISESQERMAIVVAKNNAEKVIKMCAAENVNAVACAEVTDTNRMRIFAKGKAAVDISRNFLNTNGVRQKVKVVVNDNVINPKFALKLQKNFADTAKAYLSDINICSKKGIADMFDSTIGSRTVFLPFGGKYLQTPVTAMAAKFYLPKGDTETCALSAYGYYPYLLEQSPFTGAVYSIIASVSKLVASGGEKDKVRLTFQEYFKKLKDVPEKWGEPFSALLGALSVETGLKLGSVGGKDSMSGSYENIDVPPTLISFAICPANVNNLITNVLNGGAGVKLYALKIKKDAAYIPDYDYLNKLYASVFENIKNKNISFAAVAENGGYAVAVMKSCFGNMMGFKFKGNLEDLFIENYGDIIVAAKDISRVVGREDLGAPLEYVEIGETANGYFELGNDKISVKDAFNAYADKLEDIFPTVYDAGRDNLGAPLIECKFISKAKSISVKTKTAKPKVFIPVFPGTHGEYDTAEKFEKAGGEVVTYVFRNRSNSDVFDSSVDIANAISKCNILALCGGASAGGEPDGAAKMIKAILCRDIIKDKISELLDKRDGLILGIADGFNALLKLSLLPNAKIAELKDNSPALTYNKIGRYVAAVSRVKITSNKSPWLKGCKAGEVYDTIISNAEGRFVCNKDVLNALVKNGQIASQYVDYDNKVSNLPQFNPTGSVNAIESITSKDGRILGKSGHIERYGANIMKNYEGNFDLKVFESGINYFK